MDSLLLGVPTAIDLYNFFVGHANYFYVFIFMVIESSFIPFPSEIVVPPAVYLACVNHGVGASMNPIVVVIVATAGALIGGLINYYLALWIGRPLVYKFADSKLGSICMINREKVNKAEEYFDKHGAMSTLIGRLIPAVRQLISIPAGISRMNVAVFVVFTTLGALIWNTVLGFLGYWLSLSVKPEALHDSIEHYNRYLTIAGMGLLVICVIYIVVKLRNNKRKKAC